MSETITDSMRVVPPLGLDELAEMIRRIVREEVSDILEERGFYAEPTVIEPGSPIHEDLVELRRLYEPGQLEILSYEEVFVYQPELTRLFQKNLRRYASLRGQIQRHVDEILADPYLNSERLGKVPDGLDLRGCRSVRVTQNFCLIFVVCEECRRVPACRYCFCDELPDETVVFLAVGPHKRAYALREESEEYIAS